MNVRIPPVRPARAAWLGLIGAAALLSLLSLVSLASRPTAPQELLGLLEQVRAPQPEGTDSATEARRPRGDSTRRDTQAVDQVSKRNLFSPPAGPKKPPAPIAILGDQAVFPNNEWVKVGGEYQGCKLLRTGPDWVELEADGKPLRLSVFAPREGPPAEAQAGRPTAEQPGAPEGRPDRGRFFGGRPFTVTPEMIERFRAMPPDRRERFLENMPPEIRQQIEQP